MKRITAILALLTAGVLIGCSASTGESMASKLSFDKVPPQHEPAFDTDTDEFNTANLKSPKDDDADNDFDF